MFGSHVCQQLEFAGLIQDHCDCDCCSYFLTVRDLINWVQVEDAYDVLYKIVREWSVDFAVQK